MFFWNAKNIPLKSSLSLEEPLRVLIVTWPRGNVLKVYYNQATPDGYGDLNVVNWYDSNSLGLHKNPLIPNPASVYSNFRGRTLSIPVIHVRNILHF